MTGVGLIGVISLFLFFDSLYKETFPPVTGVSKALQASEIPLHADESCQYPISLSLFLDSLYKETLPPVTGVSKASQA